MIDSRCDAMRVKEEEKSWIIWYDNKPVICINVEWCDDHNHKTYRNVMTEDCSLSVTTLCGLELSFVVGIFMACEE